MDTTPHRLETLVGTENIFDKLQGEFGMHILGNEFFIAPLADEVAEKNDYKDRPEVKTRKRPPYENFVGRPEVFVATLTLLSRISNPRHRERFMQERLIPALEKQVRKWAYGSVLEAENISRTFLIRLALSQLGEDKAAPAAIQTTADDTSRAAGATLSG